MDRKADPIAKTQLMNLVVGHILNVCSTDMILLFGSYARGEQNRYSDIDLVVVTSTKIQRKHVERQIKTNIKRYGIKSDVLIRSEQEVKTALSGSGSFLRSVILESKILYKKDSFSLEI